MKAPRSSIEPVVPDAAIPVPLPIRSRESHQRPRLWPLALRGSAAMLAVGAGAMAAPAPVELLAAGIETPQVQFGAVAGREVRLWIEVDALPACTAELARQGMELGFLVDPRSAWPPPPGSGDLDIVPSARLTARCDGRQGWTSRLGAVQTSRGDGGDRLTILTRVDRLPASRFRWVAYSRLGDRAITFPPPLPGSPEQGPPGYARWAILERAMP